MGAGVAAVELLHPDQKPVGYTTAANGRRKRVYDTPAIRGSACGHRESVMHTSFSEVAARIQGINPADLTRQINTIQMRLLDLPKTKTEALAATHHTDPQAVQPSINRLAKAK